MTSATPDAEERECRPIHLPSHVLDCLIPHEPMPTWDWLQTYMHDKDGKPFNHVDYPWCKKICDSWDDPSVRTIWLQFAARLGKSLISQACMMAAIVNDPSPTMIASPSQDLIGDTIKNKMWPMFENSGKDARRILPPPHRRHQYRMDFTTCRMYAGWSGSPTTLGDKDPNKKWGYEIDKWSKRVSEEADPLDLFRERGIENIDMCEILESTPSIKGKSRVNRGLMNSTNERFMIPCPLCGEHLQLIRGDRKTIEETGGLLWDGPKEGEHAPTVAAKTVRYLCPHCHGEWDDSKRRPAVRRGVWCPEGQRVSKDGQLLGEPAYDGPARGFQLSRLYAPTITFADYARAWMGTYRTPQNHINSWDGEVYEVLANNQTWEDLGQRLMIPDHKQGIIPEECSFLTAGIDVQAQHYVFTICGWGSHSRGWLIDWGYCHSEKELADVLNREYLHEAGQEQHLHIAQSLMDARDGNKRDEVITFCRSMNREGRWVFPSMGTNSGHMSGKPWIKEELDEEMKLRKNTKRKAIQSFYLVKVNTQYWQEWMQACIDHRDPESPLSLAIPREAADDQDLLEQMINEVPNIKELTNGRTQVEYVVKDESQPWDFRDALRYARCAAEYHVLGNWNRVPSSKTWVSSPTRAKPVERPEPASQEQPKAPPQPQPQPQRRASRWNQRKPKRSR